jgi:elongation factor P
MTKVTTSQFEKGMYLEFKGEPHQITDMQFVSPGKGSAFVRVKLKSLKTAKVQEFTYKSGESAEEVPILTREMQYLYRENDKYVFMDNSTYEQISLAAPIIGTFAQYVKEGDINQILLLDGVAVGMRFPKKVRLIVTDADNAVRGNTVSGARKPVTVETGATVEVPLFIKKGDIIGIDPETGEYVERVSKE